MNMEKFGSIHTPRPTFQNPNFEQAIPEKNRTGGLRTWNFQWYRKKGLKNVNQLKDVVEFPGLFKKKSYGISMDLGF